MENSIFHRLSSVLWGFCIVLIVLLALYVSVGRMLTSNLSAFQVDILQQLSDRVPFSIEAEKVGGEWHSFTPVIVLSGLRLRVPGSDEPPLELSAGRVSVDVLDSLRTRSLQLNRLVLENLSLRGELTSQGQLLIRGFEGGGQIGKWFREFLLNVELVELRNNRLQLNLPSGETRNLAISLRLTRDGSYRRLEANLVSNRGANIFALAEGVGDPFTPKLFSGDLYLDIESNDLGAVKDLLVDGPPGAWADGALNLQLWFAWNRGTPSLEARAEAHDLLISNEDKTWQVPLDRVTLEARLIERKNRWTLHASDVELEKDGVVAQLARLQLDAWGKALRVRASDVPLQPVNAIATSEGAMPDKLAEVFRLLQPVGILSSMQLSIGDIAAPAEDWSVEANFESVAVNSWKGAPGLSSASGYVEVDQGGGFVVLDSQQLVMDFPTIYREPLRYDDFHGTINIDWDAEALRLSSSLITAQAEEGTVQVLFGLNIPLVKSATGLEMDLLVGLQNAHPLHRVKYVPSVLNAPLRDWLSDSIGDGLVEQGAFLWRGTLTADTARLRTMQLAFNISDTSLKYHPQWPPVTVLDGIIIIDDSNVSIWSNRARLFESQVEHLSAEVWMNTSSQIMLALDGTVTGSASDGLTVLNGSPISDMVSGAFTEWVLQGQLNTDLQLQLNLTDGSSPPRVDVTTWWRDVDLQIRPGNLPLRSINGEFRYTTSQGFSSSDLVGELWGEQVSAAVQQKPAIASAAQALTDSSVEVAIATRVDMADIRQWLNLESLAFAEGDTEVGIQVLIAPGEAPLLSIASSLSGVSLDLPSPWRKSAPDEKQLFLEMPLSEESNRMTLDLAGELELRLHVTDGVLRGGVMGVHTDPPAVQAGLLHVSGHAPLVHADEWTAFISRYFYPDAGAAQTPGDSEDDTAAAEDVGGVELAITIDQLRADELVIWGQNLRDTVFSLAVEQGAWQLSAQTDWLQGEFLRAADDGVSRLHLTRLDLAGMEGLSLVRGGAQDALDLPVMDVTIDEVQRADLALGRLAFNLHSAGEVLTARNITGEIAGMQLLAEYPGQLLWRQGVDSQTEFKGRLDFQDIGQTLSHFGYERILETEKGNFEFDLRWPGAPQDFSLQQGQGAISVDIGQGSFLEAPSGASGALRVVSILNLADIVRRLSLSHMFESGIPFDGVDGEVFLHAGTIEVAGMDVEGPSSFQFSGVSEVADRTLEGELVAILPLANNLPWVAALTASLPIAAGVYVVSKLFQKQVNRLTSAVYSISGSWDDPQVEFEHIFDDTSQRTVNAQSDQAQATALPAVAPAVGGEVSPVAPPDPQSPDQSPSP